MPRPAHTLIVVTGSIRTGVNILERWSVGFRTTRHTNNTPALLTSTATLWHGYWQNNMRARYSAATVMEKVKVSHVGIDGLVEKDGAGAYLQGEYATDVPGIATAAAGFVPLQTALVASLVTGRSGPTGKGRVFLPWPDAYALGSNRCLATGDALAVAGSVKAFLNAAKASANVQVVSSKGYMSEVTGVRVGVAPDTQRSRRNEVPETYQTLAL